MKTTNFSKKLGVKFPAVGSDFKRKLMTVLAPFGKRLTPLSENLWA